VQSYNPPGQGEEALALSRCPADEQRPASCCVTQELYEAPIAVYILRQSAVSAFASDEKRAFALFFDDVATALRGNRRFGASRHSKLCMSLSSTDTQAKWSRYYQAQVSLSVKLKFLVWLAHKITEAIGTTTCRSVREKLCALAANS